MNDIFCRIICASAGTGKTYRLSLEYIALILHYYGKPEFSIDSILALTFTRKATAEIRERIVSQLSLLVSPEVTDKRSELLGNLRKLVPSESDELSTVERNMLTSALREINCDHSRLQVMTIDAYIGNIFRNIVRPLRNIESFDIDTQAISKRMPYLMNHLMQPAFRDRLNKLLSRKVSRSLDAYAKFFASLIEGRWLYYMITRRLQNRDDVSGTNLRVCDIMQEYPGNHVPENFLEAMHTLLSVVQDVWQGQQKNALESYFIKGFKQFVEHNGISVAAMMQTINDMCKSPLAAEKLLYLLMDKNIWNGNLIRKASYPEHIALMETAQQEATRYLADYLMKLLYVPEQREILDLWKIILDEYDRLIYRYKNMTYDDISWFSFEALFSEEPPFFDPQSELSASEFYQFLSHRTRFMLIDEFQDTSLIQFNIIKPIIGEITAGEGSKPFGGLIVVGDEKQSIFGWRGGQRDLLLNLQSIFPSMKEVQTERLDQCWRCGYTLMQFINSLFQEPRIHEYLAEKRMNWEYNIIRGANMGLEPDTAIEFCLRNTSKTKSAQTSVDDVYKDFVNTMVVPALEQDPYGSIAILCRKGKELSSIQQTLDEYDISSLYQPDRSICEHNLVMPLISWLRYVAWGDWSDLLAFLRSDYLMLDASNLKLLLDSIAQAEENQHRTGKWQAPDLSAIPLADQFYQLAIGQHNAFPSQICRDVIDLCLPALDKSERDYLNVHKFIGIVSEWELGKGNGTVNIPDLLSYIKENSLAEDFKQASVTVTDSLQLLTIHKSKGLQFRRVFVFYNLSAGHSTDSTRLDWALEYADKDFHYVGDFGISYHYQKILKASSYKHLWQAEQDRELLEEMNNLYVAFTRAESKLHIYFSFQNKDGWHEFLASRNNDVLPALLCDSCLEYFTGMGVSADHRGVYSLESDFKPEAPQRLIVDEIPQNGTKRDYTGLLKDSPTSGTHNWDNMQPIGGVHIVDWKRTWLETKPNLIGDIGHFYLSFILHNQVEEHDYATKRCLLRYGSLVTGFEIRRIAEACRRLCEVNPWLFAVEWSKVLTEFELLGKQGMIRIDRLMLNPASNKALIVDYKSGNIHNPMQLEEYREALISVPMCSGFSVTIKYLSIELQ